MGVKKIGKYMIALLSVIIYLVLSSTPVHAAAQPLGQVYGGDGEPKYDFTVYTQTKNKQLLDWAICGNRYLIPPDPDDLVTYDQYYLYEGAEKFRNRNDGSNGNPSSTGKGNNLYKNLDQIVASWFAISEDSDVLMDYYRNTVFNGVTPNDVINNLFLIIKKRIQNSQNMLTWKPFDMQLHKI